MKKKKIIISIFLILIISLIWHFNKKPLLNDDWPIGYSKTASSELNENLLSIKNIRNFTYDEGEKVISADYYDRTYNLNELKRVWYVYEPFGYAAHSLLSFEFENNVFLTISIEAKTNIHQSYNAFAGVFRTYPLMYVVADERDSLLVRANIRKNNVVLYPTTTNKEDARKLLLEMLREVNELNTRPKWYNTLNANCTSLIAYHVNQVWPNTIPYSWKLVFSGFSDELVYDHGFIDTSLSLKEAKIYYDITERSRVTGNNPNYSIIIREGIK
ncbi:MAG TPA: DUF4105 domain-containing protein [Candidatus Pacearchaeota archaeon]|nr:DUF4105 domain-containing protein [Candidatus Pacearchaeota archaeon]HOC53722.1 DUF4105 domain-containing protein [Candidatus Pacearchaeota archaeon]HQM24738.1 DUF4105 domain-containing protein [Candidatus Pacearchaeota archaeon]